MTGVAFFDIDSLQLEEGVVATEYERPAPAPDYPVEIHSLNDFDVVSSFSGRNLLLNTNQEHGPGDREYMSLPYDLTPVFEEHGLDQEYTMSFDLKSKDISNRNTINIYPNPGTIDPNRHRFPLQVFTVTTEYQRFSMTFKPTEGNKEKTTTYISVYGQYDTGNFPILRNIKLEKGTKATDWTPAPEDIEESDNHPLIDKINLLMDEPLRSVGDVKDRLFRDSDGFWKVERNIGVLELANHSWSMGAQSSGWNQSGETVAAYGYHIRYEHDPNVAPLVTNLKGYANSPLVAGDMEGFSVGSNDNYSVIRINKSRLSTVSSTGINNWIEENNPIVYYALKTEYSTIEILSQSLQNKLNNLRSFKGSNYVYTVDNNNLNPNLNVVFKSKGWKHKLATDSLEIDVSNKADRSDVEAGFSEVNEDIENFIEAYESYQDSIAQSFEDARVGLQGALERTAVVEQNLGEGASDWIFTHTHIRMSDEGVTIGQKEAGSYLQISNNQISFFNGAEDPVAFINGGMLHINHAIFVESIQISEFMISSEISGHITFRYVGGS